MADSTAIAEVGDTLVGLLRDEMSALLDRDEVALASPDAVGPGDDVRLSVYLYRVTESDHLKNQDRVEVDVDATRPSPLVLDLHYVLTAHPSQTGTDETAKSREQHRVLGRAMQVLYDNAIIRGSALEGTLGGEDLHVTMASESTDALVNVWSTFDEQPFRPSVTYLVTPVSVESTREEDVGRVLERTVVEYESEREASGDE